MKAKKTGTNGRIHGRPVCAWAITDQEASIHEGWILTNDSAGDNCIARIDDPQSWKDEGWMINYSRPRFKSDDSAHAFVCKRALTGAPHAIKALAMVGYAAY